MPLNWSLVDDNQPGSVTKKIAMLKFYSYVYHVWAIIKGPFYFIIPPDKK